MDKFLKRRDRVREQFSRLGIDALLVSHPVNVRYLTNFTGGSGWLFVQTGGDTLISDPRFTLQIEEECPGLTARIEPRQVSKSKIVKSEIHGKYRIGFESQSMTIAGYAAVFEEMTEYKIVAAADVVEKMRCVKDTDEIADIQQAVNIAYGAFQGIHDAMNKKALGTEIEIRNELEHRLYLGGAEDRSFNTIVGAGARAALPHSVPTSAEIAGQSHVIVDWGCVCHGYMSDLTRVLILNKHDKKLRKVYDTVLKANEAAIAAIAPGKTCEEIDAVATNILIESGLASEAAHSLGHSVGLEIHEDPRFAPGNKTVLEPGMVLTVEPGIYIRDFGGVRIEDDIVVTETGCKVLSQFVPKDWDSVCIDFVP